MLLEGIPAAMIENIGAHGRHAGRPAVAQRRDRARSRPGRSCAPPKPISGRKAINPAQKKLLEDMVEKNGRLGRKNGKGFYDYPQGQPKRLWPGLDDLLPKKLSRDADRGARRRGAEAALSGGAGGGGRAQLRGGRRHRRARGRRRLDPRLRLRAVLRRHAVLHRHDGDEEIRRAVPAAREETRRRASRRRSSCSTWRRTATASTAASRRARRRRS